MNERTEDEEEAQRILDGLPEGLQWRIMGAADQLRHQGCVQVRSGNRAKPHYRIRYRAGPGDDARSHRSISLGSKPEVVDAVRRLLAIWQGADALSDEAEAPVAVPVPAAPASIPRTPDYCEKRKLYEQTLLGYSRGVRRRMIGEFNRAYATGDPRKLFWLLLEGPAIAAQAFAGPGRPHKCRLW